jgi:hypothetical protein
VIATDGDNPFPAKHGQNNSGCAIPRARSQLREALVFLYNGGSIA